MQQTDVKGRYPEGTAERILELTQDDAPSITEDDIVVLVGGDWAHPDLGYGFLKDKADIEKSLADRQQVIDAQLASLCVVIEEGAAIEQIDKSSLGASCRNIFVCSALKHEVEKSLRLMETCGFGANEFDIYRFIERPNGGCAAVFTEVYSYWI